MGIRKFIKKGIKEDNFEEDTLPPIEKLENEFKVSATSYLCRDRSSLLGGIYVQLLYKLTLQYNYIYKLAL